MAEPAFYNRFLYLPGLLAQFVGYFPVKIYGAVMASVQAVRQVRRAGFVLPYFTRAYRIGYAKIWHHRPVQAVFRGYKKPEISLKGFPG